MKRHYYADAQRQKWWIELDRRAIARAADAGFSLSTFTLQDLDTLIRSVSAFCRAMDDAFPGRQFYHHWKTKAIEHMKVDRLTNTATKA